MACGIRSGKITCVKTLCKSPKRMELGCDDPKMRKAQNAEGWSSIYENSLELPMHYDDANPKLS